MPQDNPSSDNAPESMLLTAREAAAYLRISERTLWSLTNEGRIKATRINRRVLYTMACVRRFVDANTFDEPAA